MDGSTVFVICYSAHESWAQRSCARHESGHVKMKRRIFMSMCLMFLPLVGCAQDYIVLLNGNTLKTKAIRISKDSITYKDYENQDGQELSLLKSDVLRITYEDGLEQAFSIEDLGEKQEKPAVTSTLAVSYQQGGKSRKQMEQDRLEQESRLWETVGGALYFGGAILGIASGFYLTANGLHTVSGCVFVSGFVVGFIPLLICDIVSSSLSHKADMLAYTPIMQYDFYLGDNSLSASLGSISMLCPGTNYMQQNHAIGAGLNFGF